MIFLGKFKIIDNLISACDYDFVLSEIEKAIKNKKSLLISPIASHTLVKAHYDKNLKGILDNFDYLVPDSQWVKRSIWFLYGKRLKERVYGPELMLKVCQLASQRGWKIFLYGNKKEVLLKLKKRLKILYPEINIVGDEESKFRELTKKEENELAKNIEKSNAYIIFVSLGSPKQEIFSYYLSKKLKNNKIIIPVGAAFDFISGAKKQAPKWMGDWGLEWFFRLINEPRLWKRYLFYSPVFLWKVLSQRFNLRKSFRIFIIPAIIFIVFFNFYNSVYKKIPIRYWDEHGWVGRSYFFSFLINKKFDHPVWFTENAFEQPKLVSYIYGIVLYPYYKKNYLSNDYINFLLNFNFFSKDSYTENYKLPKNFINWGKNPLDVFDVSPEFLIKKFGIGIKKTIITIFLIRKINVYILGLNIVVAYFICYILTESFLLSFLTSIFYGFNNLLIYSSLRAQSEGIFCFLFNFSFLLIFVFFKLQKFKDKLITIILISIFIALLNQAKINGIMLGLVFILLLIIQILFFLVRKFFKKALLIFIYCFCFQLLFVFFFILVDPSLYKQPLRGIEVYYRHRWQVAEYQRLKEDQESALNNFSSRLRAIYNNYFGENRCYFNWFYYNQSTCQSKIFTIIQITLFIVGLITIIKSAIKNVSFKNLNLVFTIFFLLIQIIMSLYLKLNWDRYFIHLTLFFCIFQVCGILALKDFSFFFIHQLFDKFNSRR